MDDLNAIFLPDFVVEENTNEPRNCFAEDQVFGDHDEICRRLERTLGLYKRPDRFGFEDWTAFASVIGTKYAVVDKLDPHLIARRNISPSALLLCVIYLERLHLTDPKFGTATSLSSSELFLVSLMSACKFLYDVGELGDCYNKTWSQTFEIPVKQLNKMETTFLDAIEWNLQADLGEMEAVLSTIEYELVKQRLQWRHFMTYSDLQILTGKEVLFSTVAILELVQRLIQVFTLLAITYVAIGTITLTISTPFFARVHSTRTVLSNPFNVSLSAIGIIQPGNFSSTFGLRTQINSLNSVRARRIGGGFFHVNGNRNKVFTQNCPVSNCYSH